MTKDLRMSRRTLARMAGATALTGGAAAVTMQSAAAAWPNAFISISTSGSYFTDFYYNFSGTPVSYRYKANWSTYSSYVLLNSITIENLNYVHLYFRGVYSADGGTPTVNTGAFNVKPYGYRTFYLGKRFNRTAGQKITTHIIDGSTLADTPFRNGVEWRRR